MTVSNPDEKPAAPGGEVPKPDVSESVPAGAEAPFDAGMELPPVGESAGEPTIEELLQALMDDRDQYRDRLLRTVADMENLRKRTEKEKADTRKYAVSEFARDVLSLGDNIKRAMEAVPAEAAAGDPALKSFLEGVQILERDLLSMLDRHGVTRFSLIGERADPNKHQAVMQMEDATVPAGTIVQVFQDGYMIHDRVLRAAMVAVSTGGPKIPKPVESEPPPVANDDGEAGGGDGSGGGEAGTG